MVESLVFIDEELNEVGDNYIAGEIIDYLKGMENIINMIPVVGTIATFALIMTILNNINKQDLMRKLYVDKYGKIIGTIIYKYKVGAFKSNLKIVDIKIIIYRIKNRLNHFVDYFVMGVKGEYDVEENGMIINEND